jgi:AcrR family transcriptional regulator
MTKAKDPPKRRPAAAKSAKTSRTAKAIPAADTETRILDAARVVFTRAGTAGARMQDIAREAGVNQALLHYYFRSKQALADRVFREAVTTLLAALPGVIRQDAPLEELFRSFVRTYIDTVRRTPFLPAYMAAEAHHNPERVVAVIESITGTDPHDKSPQLLRKVQALIDSRVAAGEMRPIRAEHLMVNTMSLLAFPFVARSILGSVYAMDDAAFDRFLDERRDELPRFLLNAMRP